MSARPIRISVPSEASPGEAVEVRVLIQHDMESGYRRDALGKAIPRNIIKHFECRYDGAVVFAAEFFPGIAANPYLSFYIRAATTGELSFTWTDQHGERWRDSRELRVG